MVFREGSQEFELTLWTRMQWEFHATRRSYLQKLVCCWSFMLLSPKLAVLQHFLPVSKSLALKLLKACRTPGDSAGFCRGMDILETLVGWKISCRAGWHDRIFASLFRGALWNPGQWQPRLPFEGLETGTDRPPQKILFWRWEKEACDHAEASWSKWVQKRKFDETRRLWVCDVAFFSGCSVDTCHLSGSGVSRWPFGGEKSAVCSQNEWIKMQYCYGLKGLWFMNVFKPPTQWAFQNNAVSLSAVSKILGCHLDQADWKQRQPVQTFIDGRIIFATSGAVEDPKLQDPCCTIPEKQIACAMLRCLLFCFPSDTALSGLAWNHLWPVGFTLFGGSDVCHAPAVSFLLSFGFHYLMWIGISLWSSMTWPQSASMRNIGWNQSP